MSDSTVSGVLPLRLLTGVDGVVPLNAMLVYDASDPLAVTALFESDAEQPVRWTFARDLLRDGLHRRVGDGDLVVWPSVDSDGEPAVTVRLCSPDGDALLEAPATVIEDFLTESARLVPFGHESRLIDVDAALQAILDGIA